MSNRTKRPPAAPHQDDFLPSYASPRTHQQLIPCPLAPKSPQKPKLKPHPPLPPRPPITHYEFLIPNLSGGRRLPDKRIPNSEFLIAASRRPPPAAPPSITHSELLIPHYPRARTPSAIFSPAKQLTKSASYSPRPSRPSPTAETRVKATTHHPAGSPKIPH